jgi:lactate dehydrogenase-like 2-hydroxyacid dehydrogenase
LLNTAPALATQVSGKRIGIFGMGNIGQAIARRASGFDMEILYNDRQKLPDWITSGARLIPWPMKAISW